MSRRDTILMAVLINMGLLIALFVSALKPSSISEMTQETLAKSKEVKQKLPIQKESPSIDQIDSILGAYVENNKIKPIPIEIETASVKKVEPQKVEEVAKAPEVPLVSGMREVIVRSGDVLEKIAKQNGSSVEEIMKANRLNDTRLQIGQILYIPAAGAVTAVAPVEKPKESAPQVDVKYYTVKHGDSPWSIAIKNNIKLDELLRLNGLDETKAKKLKPGDKLRIR